MQADNKTYITNAANVNTGETSQRSTKKWFLAVVIIAAIGLLLFALPTIILDPLFHYHAPLSGWEYILKDERYQNDGIVKHFSYDAIITGTSMTENFKPSQFDKLWKANTIKVPFAGGGYKEIGENLKRAISANDSIRNIVWGLDTNFLERDKDWTRYESLPEYLYDYNPLNDGQYFLNKAILLNYTYSAVYAYTRGGGVTTSLDDYCSWTQGLVFGREALLVEGVGKSLYVYSGTRSEPKPFTEESRRLVRENLQQNVLPIISENPQITFYLFLPPFSVCYFDSLLTSGEFDLAIQQMEYAAELLLQYENVRFFSFFDAYDITCNLDNYRDIYHYHEDVNTQMLSWMHAEEHRLTESTYKQHFAEIRDYYLNFDYKTALTIE